MFIKHVAVVSAGFSGLLAGGATAWAQSSPYTMWRTSVTHDLPDVSRAGTATGDLGSFNIVIAPGSGLSSNTSALAAFNRAASQWSAFISDPIAITINADLSTTAPGGGVFPGTVIGSTAGVNLQGSYTTVRNAMVSDGGAQPAAANNAILASLPTSAQFLANVPSGRSLNGNIVSTKANFKALGFTGLDGTIGVSDGQIVFNSAFSFDFDNSDGVTPGQMDFETVAAHEIGHALGFTSAVDVLDQTTAASLPTFGFTTLDMFRFSRTGANPTSAASFTTTARNFVPGADVVTDDTSDEFRMSTGLSLGDGNQASHWKDDALTGAYVGMMDPTLSFGTTQKLTYADLRAMDLIGYDLKLWTPGDANHDASVNFADLVSLAQNYNLTGKLWTDSDFTGDGVVSFPDLVLLAQNYGTIPSALLAAMFDGSTPFDVSAVPEPMGLISLAALALPTIRRRRS
jgi:hypothetical protein